MLLGAQRVRLIETLGGVLLFQLGKEFLDLLFESLDGSRLHRDELDQLVTRKVFIKRFSSTHAPRLRNLTAPWQNQFRRMDSYFVITLVVENNRASIASIFFRQAAERLSTESLKTID